MAIFQPTQVSWYQNVSILDSVWAKDYGGGGDKWSYKTCKAPVKSSPPTNQHPTFYNLDALPVAQPTVSKHWREKVSHSMDLLTPSSARVFWPCLRRLKTCGYLVGIAKPLTGTLTPVLHLFSETWAQYKVTRFSENPHQDLAPGIFSGISRNCKICSGDLCTPSCLV